MVREGSRGSARYDERIGDRNAHGAINVVVELMVGVRVEISGKKESSPRISLVTPFISISIFDRDLTFPGEELF